MKLQNLIVIFLLIIIPILLVSGYYISLQIKTMTLQNQYNIKLSDATKEAIEAFEINTVEWNNEYSNIADSKRRDIEASINTFTTSLANNLKISGSRKQAIMSYVPSIAYTLYDGYYIYSPTEIAKLSLDERGVADLQDGKVRYISKNGGTTDNRENAVTTYEHILKPFVEYTEILEGTDIIINYTLDNYIKIYGTIDGEYQVKEGYVTSINQSVNSENLSENIGYKNLTNSPTDPPTYNYYIKNYNYVYDTIGEKVYYDNINETDGDKIGWFILNNQQKSYLSKTGDATKWKKAADGNLQNLNGSNINADLFDYSAINYYIEANNFTRWVNSKLGSDFDFLEINEENNPEDKNSKFYKHKTEVIKKSISEGLNQAISSYSAKSTYNYKMPVLKEEDWEQVLNNVSIITFLQGLPIGTKYYNNYAIATSTRNKEYVNPNEIYFIKENDDNDDYYHKSCNCNISGYTGYNNIDFIIKNIGENYYYPHNQLACYDCIINSNNNIDKIKVEYLTALARERYAFSH